MVGTLHNDAKPAVSVPEAEQGSENRNDLDTNPATTFEEDDHLANAKELRQSFSSASSSGSDLLELDPDKFSFSTVGDAGSKKHDNDTVSGSECKEDEAAESSTPCQLEDHSNDANENYASATESPPTQVMDRTPDASPSEAYRIPSSVFARTNTNAAQEWSIASNDSLFSIHMGNMSFTRDNLSWISKSGELGLCSDSSPFIDYTSNEPPSVQLQASMPTETAKQNCSVEDNFGVTVSRGADTMSEVIKENEDNGSQKPPDDTLPRSSSLSRCSDASIKSFAFPVLTGVDRYGSLPTSHKRGLSAQPSSQPSSQPPTPKSPEQPQVQPHPRSQTTKAAASLKATTSLTQARWWSCFSWCSRS